MHIVTGMLLAGLLGKKRPGSELPPLLRLGGPVQTTHLLPGRVRFHVARLHGNRAACAEIASRLGSIEGVESAEANAITGGVLLRYRTDVLQPDLLVAAIVRLLGLERELQAAPTPGLVREARSLGDALNRSVYEQTGGWIDLWTAVPVVLGLIGIRRIFTEGASTFPAGLTMAWWAYMALFGSRRESR